MSEKKKDELLHDHNRDGVKGWKGEQHEEAKNFLSPSIAN
jgi:hypothetical protein